MGLLTQIVGGTQGVRSALWGLIIRVGGTSAARLARMDFDQLSVPVELHQLAVTPHLKPCARRAGAVGSRVDGIAVVDVMVLMHDSVIPVGDIIRLTIIGQEFGLFLFLEDHQRQALGGGGSNKGLGGLFFGNYITWVRVVDLVIGSIPANVL
jgi:hypothetical protein